MLETMGGRNAAHRRTRRFPLRLGVCLLALAGAVLFAQAGASEAPAEGAQPAGGATASTVYAWGEDGLGSVTSLDETPVTVPAAAGATAIAAGDPASFAVLPDGHVISWQTGSKPRPVAGLRDVTTISAGFDHILALLSNGTVAAWGENYSGQLGDGTTTASTTPVAVTGLSDVKALANGYGFSLALRADGTVMGWGDDGIGQLALGRSPSLSSCSGIPCATTPVAIPGLSHVTAIAAGSSDGY
ncbi:MAG TPA: hypothetical protein VMD59_01270, partial [Acidimicrobiales bacterium]|nr:hypothetical protein [Acidimicrobiales bacterium]